MGTPQDTPSANAFARHAQEDAALAATSPEEASNDDSGPGLTWVGRVGIFLLFPTAVGVVGMYFAYLEKTNNPERILSFDQDFVMPFLLSLAMAIVIGFQTGGYTSRKVKPVLSWPKVKRVKRVVHRKNGKVVAPEDVPPKNKNA
ncbi:predicted protein [Phaeodactylum tricornutum CCAP 1055/1]|uniref:Transmembrane protein n=2 Tax=Phaeodactylum tricornutum TaxID=2850 RepID=B7FTR9_PHATC|nr:predicted protein [Phaeodactylum tricornutum CCAP 1055/1]EEC49862.1 predicted protein [Phaeodactylum tricornutum CCAP 1055/1]|eukprot:XP_002178197.1 predicted protein [Phaeodactylum tricornutum CCAP 1055/1]